MSKSDNQEKNVYISAKEQQRLDKKLYHENFLKKNALHVLHQNFRTDEELRDYCFNTYGPYYGADLYAYLGKAS